MKIAIEGCAHGELEKIYACIEELQRREGINIDLLICCGDFQSVRNQDDLQCMAVPDKFKNMCTFYKYYSGEKRAPVLTIFIGGNHEASNYLQELPYGGWVAPNIYYLGRAGVVRFGNVRIAGLSGIFKGRDYLQGLWEIPPYTNNSLRSVYHIRALDVFRLKQLKDGELQIFLSHDWPRGITNYGNREQLLQRKPFLREDIESNQLGSAPAEDLLHILKPTYWFAAHLHCQFAAVVPHNDGGATCETKFLALDKCLPRRRHLQIVDLPEFNGEKKLKHDPEWLAVLKNTNHLLTVRNVDNHLPGPGCHERYNFKPTEQEIEEVVKLFGDQIFINEDSFVKTAPAYIEGSTCSMMFDPISNPQTEKLCEILGIDDPVRVVLSRSGRKMRTALTQGEAVTTTPLKRFSLVLPTPMTPILNSEPDASFSSMVQTDADSFLTDASLDQSVDSECSTPLTTQSGKKTFKRRNQSLYTSDADDVICSSQTNTNINTPRSTKLPYKSDS